MTEEEKRLLEEARRSREETEELREEAAEAEEDAGNPWAKTSSGDAENVTEDDRRPRRSGGGRIRTSVG